MQTQVLEQDHNTVTESAILSKQIQIAKSPNSTRSNLSDNYDYWHGENGFYIEYNENNEAIIYPESDGQPMAENTKQYDFLTDIVGNLRIMTADDPNILVVGDLLWYPVQGQTGKGNVYTPDVMVVIGRPKGHRGSYLQWLENDIAPQIVFEIWSISNTAQHKREKFNFYQKHGVQEYYTIDSETDIWEGWIRDQDMLEKIEDMDGWRSPRLGFQFKCESKEMKLLY
ncbi:MAG: Uma2 family endonuclease, partial [Chloroflexota bacterium]